jgi:hypothetical protein
MALAGTTTLRASDRGQSAAPAPAAAPAASPAARPARKAPPAQPACGAKPAPAAKHSKPHVELTWQPSHSPNLMGYNVYRAESPTGAKQLLNPTPIPETCYEDRAVQRDHTYYYVVRAVAADGSLSSPSNEATAPITLPGRARSHQQPAGAMRGESHVHHGTNAAAKR